MVTDGTGNEPPKSNVSLDALAGLGNPAPIDNNGAGAGDGGTGTPPVGNPNPDGGAGTNPPAGDPQGVGTGAGTPPSQDPPTFTFPDKIEELLPLLADANNVVPEVVEYRNLLLTTFKGKTLDTSGNVLNEQGEVVLSADTLTKYVTTGELPTNEKGEIINAKGEVIGVSTPPASTVSVVKESLKTQLGIDLSTLDVPDTEEGLVQLTQEAIKERSKGAIINFLEANPDIKGLYQHIRLGGKVEDYKSSHIDYGSINIKTLEESSKIDLLNKMFTLQGTPNKDNMIELIKGAGEEQLNKAVAGAVLYLDGQQKQENLAREQALAAKAKQEADETVAYWNNVNTLVTNGKVGDIVIPLNEREAFFNYMSKPVTDDLYSANDLDAEKDALEFQLLVSYLRYKKGNVSTLANIIAKQNQVENLKSRFDKLANITGNGTVPITGKDVNNGAPLSLDILMKR